MPSPSAASLLTNDERTKASKKKEKITHNSAITQRCSRARSKKTDFFPSFPLEPSSKLWKILHGTCLSFTQFHSWTPSMWWSLRKCWMKWFVAARVWLTEKIFHWRRKEKVDTNVNEIESDFCSSILCLFTSVNKVRFDINGFNDNRQEQAQHTRVAKWKSLTG